MAFYFVAINTAATHLLAFDRDAQEWRVPCGLIRKPERDDVTYAPTKPMCQKCVVLTQPRIARRPETKSANEGFGGRDIRYDLGEDIE